MKELIIATLFMVSLATICTGCGHNTGAFTIGTRVNFGVDPANATASVSYTDGLNVLDVSRENSEWELEIDADTGLSVDAKTGHVKGVKRIKRKIGVQVTGYLVELAEKNPDLAKYYIGQMTKQQTETK